jgi:lipoprotein-anchoring transpeptidase ErfK/SrfK
MTRVDGLGVSMATGELQPFKVNDRSSSLATLSISRSFSNSWWRIAALTAAGAIGVASQAQATVFWPDPDPGFSQPAPEIVAPPRQRKVRQHSQGPSQKGRKETEAKGKETAKPHGPLVIAISINKQNMRIYDANGFFAETPISTGMRGHPTPMGVFSVVQKEKLHHSNIYSGAPMPFMQRITWSGIAIHAGVLPGYPASHGCIRMPMAFAVKMYGWTRMGARVVIAPDEIVPTNFSHPMLAAQKMTPQPVAADEPNAAAKADKANLELRSTIGHGDSAQSLTDAAPTLLREQTRTADAGAFSITKSPVAMSSPTPSIFAKSSDSSSRESGAAKLEPAKSGAESATAQRADDKASGTTSSQATSPDIKSAATDGDKTGKKPDQTGVSVPASDDAAKAAAAPESKPFAKPEDKPAANVAPGVSDPKKDQGRLAGTEKAPASKADAAPAAPKRTGQIAVFVSRKDSKLYVRQNFAPLFDVPVTIAPSDRPLGTHVFTAEVDKDDPNVLHWSVVSLPKPARYAEQRDEDERTARRRKIAGAVEIKAPAPEPDSPAEALDRLTIPADTRARIAEALSTGSSIIVSDQGIAGGETGEGTDFIVSLR